MDWNKKELKNPNNLINLILANKLIIKCPAIILAARRIDNVKGRIKWLILSINTIIGDKYKGLPSGTKWAALILKFFIQPIKKKENQITNPIPNLINGCALLVNTKGNNPITFVNIK